MKLYWEMVRRPADQKAAQDDPFAMLDGGADYRRERKAL